MTNNQKLTTFVGVAALTSAMLLNGGCATTKNTEQSATVKKGNQTQVFDQTLGAVSGYCKTKLFVKGKEVVEGVEQAADEAVPVIGRGGLQRMLLRKPEGSLEMSLNYGNAGLKVTRNFDGEAKSADLTEQDIDNSKLIAQETSERENPFAPVWNDQPKIVAASNEPGHVTSVNTGVLIATGAATGTAGLIVGAGLGYIHGVSTGRRKEDEEQISM